ncbi:hypothetical protein FNYG_14414 [Fusarium nygamai]|uniref:Uncharacterized protein n=1 Tax=Gibberella nygamai TaxID=42673 RepID=A0A2K0USP8_GIBNY|nr:hypothetical protein FNYG_14414 [Fusarium nygamai]
MRTPRFSPKRKHKNETRVKLGQGNTTSPGNKQSFGRQVPLLSLIDRTIPAAESHEALGAFRSVHRNEKALSQPDKNAQERTKKEPHFLPDL